MDAEAGERPCPGPALWSGCRGRGEAPPRACALAAVLRQPGLTGSTCVSQFRAEAVVPARMAEMIRYVKERNFQGFGQLTMKDSNQFHATCLDTFPPISYLNDISRRIIHLVHRFNAHHGQTKARWGRGSTGNPQSGPRAVICRKTSTCLSVAKPHRACLMLERAEHRRLPSPFHFGCMTH